jgi:DNA-binding NarL/FixJ family response regulator
MSHPEKIRVFSVDDQPLMRDGIEAMTNQEPDMLMIGQASNGRDAIHEGHVKHIMEKLDACDRTQAEAIGVRRGIIRL